MRLSSKILTKTGSRSQTAGSHTVNVKMLNFIESNELIFLSINANKFGSVVSLLF